MRAVRRCAVLAPGALSIGFASRSNSGAVSGTVSGDLAIAEFRPKSFVRCGPHGLPPPAGKGLPLNASGLYYNAASPCHALCAPRESHSTGETDALHDERCCNFPVFSCAPLNAVFVFTCSSMRSYHLLCGLQATAEPRRHAVLSGRSTHTMVWQAYSCGAMRCCRIGRGQALQSTPALLSMM